MKVQVAHFKLCHSRAFMLRAYPLQTHEMLFDAHNHCLRALGGIPQRGIYDNMKTAVDKVGRGKQRDEFCIVKNAACIMKVVFCKFLSTGLGVESMKKPIFYCLIITSTLTVGASAYADPALELAEQKQCFSCHSVDKEKLAPSFKAIAHRYSGMKNVDFKLEQVVMKGSESTAYHWGTMKMPTVGAREPVNQEEAEQLVQWILDQE